MSDVAQLSKEARILIKLEAFLKMQYNGADLAVRHALPQFKELAADRLKQAKQVQEYIQFLHANEVD